MVAGVLVFEALTLFAGYSVATHQGFSQLSLDTTPVSIRKLALHVAVLFIGGAALRSLYLSGLRNALLAFLLSLMIAGNMYSWGLSMVIPVSLALGLNAVIWRASNNTRAWTCICTSLIALIVDGLWPLQLASYPTNFVWVPFYSALSGDTVSAVPWLLAYLYLFFSLFTLMNRMGCALNATVFTAGILVIGIEWAHRFISGQSGEATQVALLVLGAIGARLLQPPLATSMTARSSAHLAQCGREPLLRVKNHRGEFVFATLAYVAIITYGTLFTSDAWRVPSEFDFLAWEGLRATSRADILENVLGYVPLGVLLTLSLGHRMSRLLALTLAMLAGVLLSICLELTQIFVPGRTSSATDVLANGVGTVVGSLISTLIGRSATPIRALTDIRRAMFHPGVIGDLGVLVIILWIASQVSPFIPTVDVATVRAGLSAAWQKLHAPGSLNTSPAIVYACYLTALGCMWSIAARTRGSAIAWYLMIVLGVLLIKPFFWGRELSLEALIGFFVAIPLVMILSGWPLRIRAAVGVVMLVAGFAIYELTPGSGPFHAFNWVPFRGEITNTLNGVMGATGLFWVFFSLSVLFRIAAGSGALKLYATLGGIGLVIFVSACEWSQQRIIGRYGDVTTIAMALTAWVLAWRFRGMTVHPVVKAAPPGGVVRHASAI